MLYEIDKSCLELLDDKNNISLIAFFEQLALDRRKCKNLLVAEREVLNKFAKWECLSVVAREIYTRLANRSSEYRNIVNNTTKYCRLVANGEVECIGERGHEIIILPIEKIAMKELTGKTLIVTENIEDIGLYKIIGQYYIRRKRLGNVRIDFEERNGGGSTIATVVKEIISESMRMFICILDSDKKYADQQSPGDTMKKVIETVEDKMTNYNYDILPLEIHEVENLIPISVLEMVVTKKCLNEEALKFMKRLIKNDSSSCSPVFFFDLKKGIPANKIVKDKNADAQEKKRFAKNQLYRIYWEKYICEYGILIDQCECSGAIIPGVCDNILKYSIEYCRDYLMQTFEETQIDLYMEKIWMEIGERIYCWGCVGNRLAC